MTARAQRRRGPDPFEVLGIAPTASPQEITAAYRSLAKKYHPDRYHGRSERVQRAAEQRMMELNEAYKAARDGGSRRSAEDDLYAGGPRSGVWPGTAPGTWARTAASSTWLRATREQAERAARAHEAQARSFHLLRREAKKAVTYGTAVARSKSRMLTRVPSTLYGIGQAAHSNELTCRGCRTVQRLPGNWQERLADTAYFCSGCDAVLLSR